MVMIFKFNMKTMKKMFFDRAKIKRKVDARTLRVLSKFGAFVRQGARRSIRTRKRVSFPGHPPSGHVGTLKRGILFGYDSRRRSVVIGPVRFPTKTNSPRVLPALEYGGKTDHITAGRITIKARPFMEPAFQTELPKVPGLWAGSIK